MARVRAVAEAAYEHGETPLEQIIEAVQPERTMSQNPLFQVCFSLLQAHRARRLDLVGGRYGNRELVPRPPRVCARDRHRRDGSGRDGDDVYRR